MKLTAPVNTFPSCVAQINAGADEIFASYNVPFFSRLSFSARPQQKKNGFSMATRDEFSEIVKFAADHNVRVFLTANTSYFSDYPIPNIDLEREYIDYVGYGVSCGIDAVIVADVGLMRVIHKEFPSLPIYCSTLLDVDNLSQIRFLSHLGVKRVVLSYQITMAEILRILESCNPIEIELFGYGGCSFPTNCMLGHSERFGIPCENEYITKYDQSPGKHICSAQNCALCSIWDLHQAGVTAIKIQGRERDYRRVIPLTNIFKSAIELAKTCSCRDEYLKRIYAIRPLWWKHTFCDCDQCKYSFSRDNRSISNTERRN